jgi:hypothetical protein
MRRRRFRIWAKWVCTLAAVSAVGLALLNLFYAVGYERFARTPPGVREFQIASGILWIQYVPGGTLAEVTSKPGWSLVRSRGWTWALSKYHAGPYSGWDWRAGLLYSNESGGRSLGISLAYPVLLTTIPAALLLYTDRRRFGPGRCVRCGYDGAGLAPGANCPECGRLPAPAPAPAEPTKPH